MSERKPRGKVVSGMTYADVLEEYNAKQYHRSLNMRGKPYGVADALDRAYYGYSNKPRVRPEKKKQR